MGAFVTEMAECGLNNTIVGTSEDDEVLVEISYEKEDTKSVDELGAFVYNLREQIEEEE
jgi:hypothetical protein